MTFKRGGRERKETWLGMRKRLLGERQDSACALGSFSHTTSTSGSFLTSLIIVPLFTVRDPFSFCHFGHLQTDNMSLQFVLMPWSLSVNWEPPPHLC